MLVRYHLADEASVLCHASFAARELRSRRLETITTVAGVLILLAMVVALIVAQA